MGFGWRAAAAAVLLLGVGALAHPDLSLLPHLGSHRPAVANPHPSPWPGLAAATSVPQYSSPASPPAKETTYLGSLKWTGPSTDTVVSVKTATGTRAVGFKNAAPVWVSLDGHVQNIAPANLLPQAGGFWQLGSNAPLTSFADAGPYAYVTSGPNYAVLFGTQSHWVAAPGVNVVRSQIAALPANPADSMLLTEQAGGSQALYVRSGLAAPWTPLALPGTPVLQTVAVANQYWVLAGGSIRTWSPGGTWHTLYAPPRHFVVSTFAVSPTGSRIVVLLASSSNAGGIGPMLLSNNGGRSWSVLPPPWPNGSSATDLVLEPSGAVAAFLPGPPGLVEQYSPAAGLWTILPTPTPNATGIGSLTANGNGNLLYSDAAGNLYRYVQSAGAWQALPPVPGGTGDQPPSLLMGIGSDAAVASGTDGWYVFVPGGG